MRPAGTNRLGPLSWLLALALLSCGGRTGLAPSDEADTTGGMNAGGGGQPSLAGGTNLAGSSNVAGSSTGSGGAAPTAPLDNAALCNRYCALWATVCHTTPDHCNQQCLEDLSPREGDCLAIKRDLVACVADVVQSVPHCDTSLEERAREVCGDYDSPPPECEKCETTFSAEGPHCRTLKVCELSGTVELSCSDNPVPGFPCQCWVHGGSQITWGGEKPSSAMDACLDPENQAVCFRTLPPHYLP